MASYKDSGVDIKKADKLVKHLGITGFGGAIKLDDLNFLTDSNPYWSTSGSHLVLSTDGVGTKILIADELKIYDTIGIDLVAMCVNDILCHGAKPIAFLDYYATGKLTLAKSKKILAGIKKGCEIAGCQLAGGETAEMPGLYKKTGVGTFDLAGFAVGIARQQEYRPNSRYDLQSEKDDILIGIPSSGFHSNGFSLIRKTYKEQGLNYNEDLLTPTRIYVDDILPVLDDIKALAHITGGGIHGNLSRIIPDGLSYRLDIKYPPLFEQFRIMTQQTKEDFESTFNCGIGMILVANKKKVDNILKHIVDAKVIGSLY